VVAPGEDDRILNRVASLHPIEGAGAATAEMPVITSLAALLTRHVLRDGELVILILKPSVWFIPLSSLAFNTAVVVCMIAARVFAERLPTVQPRLIWEAGAFVIAGRLMWAVVQWSNRLYVLTDLRIVRISGVFNLNIFDCPLRKVARTRMVTPARERICLVGSIEIIPSDDSIPVAAWQTVVKPLQVREVVVATINRAKQGCIGD
jgi:hypothetical protein